jgi:hypothetical protein
MKTMFFNTSIKVAALVAALSYATGLQAGTVMAVQTLDNGNGPVQFQYIGFSDSKEAGMLRDAYIILATGDHDYKGHRAKAMKAVEAAGKLLGLNLAGDAKDRQPQLLSDDKLREAQGLITQVLGAAEVKDQKRVTKHLTEAVNQINTALTDR